MNRNFSTLVLPIATLAGVFAFTVGASAVNLNNGDKTTNATVQPSPDRKSSESDERALEKAKLDAHRHWIEKRRDLGFTDDDDLVPTQVTKNSSIDGWTVRLRQTYRGIPVFGGDAIVNIGRNGSMRLVTRTLRRPISVKTTPEISSASAESLVLRLIQLSDSIEPPVSNLEIFPKSWKFPDGSTLSEDRLVWHVSVVAESVPAVYEYYVDAATSKVILKYNSQPMLTTCWSSLNTPSRGKLLDGLLVVCDKKGSTLTGFLQTPCAGVGSSVDCSDPAYDVDSPALGLWGGDAAGRTNARRATIIKSNTLALGFGTGDWNDVPSIAGEAFGGVLLNFSFLSSQLGREGIDGMDRQTFAAVRVGGTQLPGNAAWFNSFALPEKDRCFCVAVGPGNSTLNPAVGLDVVSHEIGHGLSQYTYLNTSDPIQTGEQGAINEAMSDIYAYLVSKYYAPLDTRPDWLGESTIRSNWTSGQFQAMTGIRYFDLPSRDGVSQDCWHQGIGGLDSHHASGPLNLAFQLLTNGGASPCVENTQIVGIGVQKAREVWFKAMTSTMSRSDDYRSTLLAWVDAAEQLYGPGSPEANAVVDAFALVKVVP